MSWLSDLASQAWNAWSNVVTPGPAIPQQELSAYGEQVLETHPFISLPTPYTQEIWATKQEALAALPMAQEMGPAAFQELAAYVSAPEQYYVNPVLPTFGITEQNLPILQQVALPPGVQTLDVFQTPKPLADVAIAGMSTEQRALYDKIEEVRELCRLNLQISLVEYLRR